MASTAALVDGSDVDAVIAAIDSLIGGVGTASTTIAYPIGSSVMIVNTPHS